MLWQSLTVQKLKSKGLVRPELWPPLRGCATHKLTRPADPQGIRLRWNVLVTKLELRKIKVNDVHTVCANYFDLYYSYQRRHP